VLELSPDRLWAIEIKKSSAPSVGRSFTVSSNDLEAQRRILVHKGSETFPMRGGVEAMTLLDAVQAVRGG
jgi:uncharacterized protein